MAERVLATDLLRFLSVIGCYVIKVKGWEVSGGGDPLPGNPHKSGLTDGRYHSFHK